ncbi:MAG: ATP-binding cassette domain-containing protein, partial [Gammaproteobacteria bacterium]|nr:ATP-binding cassette domain-containing protein [Gammaproteobacteria bacterium]
MLKLINVALRRGRKLVLDGVDLSIDPKARLGVVGANGAGKSSLIALLAGELEPDAGQVDVAGGVRIAQVAQESDALERSLLDTVLDGDGELRELQARLIAAEQAGDGNTQASLLAGYESIGGYQAQARAGRLLAGLGFAPDALHRPVASLSGGWRRRAALAQALMCRSDLLLLDEPTNHLDLDAVVWLEGWLKHYPGALVMVSHDREFLDAVVRGIAHLDNARLTLYAGNYSAFERQRAEDLARQQSSHERQQRERARLQAFVDRFRAKASKARQAQSRLKALQRLPEIAPAHVDSPFRLQIPLPERLPRPLLSADGVACGYDGIQILSAIKRSLEPGLRVALLGANGAGKST